MEAEKLIIPLSKRHRMYAIGKIMIYEIQMEGPNSIRKEGRKKGRRKERNINMA
jgi:hypothetical protein